ncbi:hypothetical protein T484DRAFT_1893878, partial [Baffinella frigidus]
MREVRIGVSAAAQDNHLEEEGDFEEVPEADMQLIGATPAGPSGTPHLYARGGLIAPRREGGSYTFSPGLAALGPAHAPNAGAALVRYGAGGGCAPSSPGFPHCLLGVHRLVDAFPIRGFGGAGRIEPTLEISGVAPSNLNDRFGYGFTPAGPLLIEATPGVQPQDPGGVAV